MDTGPMAGLVATIVVPFAATPRAAAPIFSVMLSVVFGLITLIFMTPGHSSPACRTRRGGRPASSVPDRGSGGLRFPAGGGSLRKPRPGRGLRNDPPPAGNRSEEHTSELQSLTNLVCRLLLEKKKAAEN